MKKTFFAAVVALSLSLAGPLFAQPVYAACPSTDTSKGQVYQGLGSTGSDCNSNGVTDFISAVVSILSIIVGIAAVIMVIVSGMKYITSGGDSGKVSSAKNTLIYALIGLAIAALAQVLVHFVLTTSSSALPNTCPAGNHRSADGTKCIPD